MDSITEKAFAKLNISLDVTGLRDDGYHEMKMVMQSVELWDDVQVRLTSGGGMRVRTNLRYLPNDGRNIAVKAAEAFFQAAGRKRPGCEINIKKRVPVCAGLGGGSSDAAAVLRALNTLTGAGLSGAKLEQIGRKLGSDVPFCICGGTQLASGRGDELQTLKPLPRCFAVICKPDFPISTPELFRYIDNRANPVHPDTAGLLEAIENGALREVTRRMYNVFEDVLPQKYAEVAEIKRRLLEYGAAGAVMSGTGSAVFGLFSTEREALTAKNALGENYKSCFCTRLGKRIEIEGE